MKKNIAFHLPILAALFINTSLFGWAAFESGNPIYRAVTPFSFIVSLLVFITGLIPALIRPQANHTLIACFSIFFSFFLSVPFEFSDLPVIHPGSPLVLFLNPYLIARLLQAAILLPMALHVSARFPRVTGTPARAVAAGYVLSAILLFAFFASRSAWQRVALILLLFVWFTFVILFFIRNLLQAARDPNPENYLDAQRARIVGISLFIAEVPLWIRPLTLALGLDVFSYNLLLLFQLFIPIGIAYAVMRHDLFGIDRALRRTLVYGFASLLLLTFYLFLTTSLTSLFADSLTSRPLAPVISLFVAAILFDPTRRLIQTWLDKWLYPDRLKFESAIQSMQYLLARANRRDEIVNLLNDVFPNQIGAEWGALKLFPEPDVPPPHTAPAWNTRLVAGSVTVGGYWLGPRQAGPQYEGDEVKRLHALAGQAALALAYANAYESLYELNRNLESRVKEQTERAVADEKSIAAYEERQRIARDLHDSVTQQMFGLHLMARGLKASAPEGFKEKLAELESLASGTLKEMRLMLDQLRDASGEEKVDFAESVRAECEAFSNRSGPEGGALLSVTLEMPRVVILPKNISNEAAWILREALQNVVKHSGGRTVIVSVKVDSFLHASIADDGAGFDVHAAPAGHYGLRGMRERALALGGGLTVDSEIGRGTILSYKIPLPR
ncbi:MAG: sensor histidine kinase [Anaerolineales bacterium]|jgi:signal transduction histidine kinase|nr:sensor histidine kinase [Anaerolineales bacterium]